MIIDLRDYTTQPGARDALIERCERSFFPEQTRLGARLLGVFRDADRDDRFVWLRAMPDLATRQRVLTDFYVDGELWKSQRNEVNGWIADSDNVLLMRPASVFATPAEASTPTVVAMYSCIANAAPANAVALLRDVATQIVAAGGRLLVLLATDPVPNNFPRHAIRSGEQGFVWLASFAGARSASRAVNLAGVEQRNLLPAQSSWLR